MIDLKICSLKKMKYVRFFKYMKRFFLIVLFINSSLLYAAWQNITDANVPGRGNFVTDQTFHLLYGGAENAIRGDFNATGNSILWSDHPNNANLISDTTTYKTEVPAFNNNTYTLNDSEKRNSSSAKLSLPPYVKGSDIVWAMLYWQGHVYRKDGNYNSTSVDQAIDGWNKVTLRDSNGVMHKIEAPIGNNNLQHKVFQYTYTKGIGFRHHYGAEYDVTDIVKNSYSSTNNTFTVGNIIPNSKLNEDLVANAMFAGFDSTAEDVSPVTAIDVPPIPADLADLAVVNIPFVAKAVVDNKAPNIANFIVADNCFFILSS